MLTGLPFPALLEELAAPREVPGAGSALAAALAAAAAVVQMAARLSPGSWADAAGVAAQAEALRERAVQIVDEDAEAYRLALEARAAADESAKPEQRDWTLGQITAATLNIGNSNNGNNGGSSSLSLGGGTNTINANTITIGAGKAAGQLNFQEPL